MGKTKRQARSAAEPKGYDNSGTLKDLLSPDVIAKLKEQAKEQQAEIDRRKEAERLQAEQARKEEQRRKENDFSYLLNNSKLDWHNFK